MSYDYAEQHALGEVLMAPMDVYFSETETCQPDLIVEVLLPSTGYYDLTHKKKVYEVHDVREYWIVDPREETIVVYSNQDGGFAEVRRVEDTQEPVHSHLLDGFQAGLQDLLP